MSKESIKLAGMSLFAFYCWSFAAQPSPHAPQRDGRPRAILGIIERQLGDIPLGTRLWDFSAVRGDIRSYSRDPNIVSYFEILDDPVPAQWVYHFSARSRRLAGPRKEGRLLLFSIDKDPSPSLSRISVRPLAPFTDDWLAGAAAETTAALGVEPKQDGKGLLWLADGYNVSLSPEGFSVVNSAGPLRDALLPFLNALGRNFETFFLAMALLIGGPFVWILVVGPFVVSGTLERLLEHLKLRYHLQYEEDGLRSLADRYALGRGSVFSSYFASREIPVKFPRLAALMGVDATGDAEFERLKKRLYGIDRVTNVLEKVLIAGCLIAVAFLLII